MLGEAALDEALVVLVVEDDQTIQSIVEEALSDGGFEPAIAASGEEALTLLGGSKYRVLVIDIKLGKDRIRGWDVARRARAINPDLPVVYITGANADEWAAQGVPNSIPACHCRFPASEYRVADSVACSLFCCGFGLSLFVHKFAHKGRCPRRR
jgi:CheY-like chemotaxis protein